MVALCRTVDDSFRNMNEQIAQLRDETLGGRSWQQAPVQVQPRAVFHQVSEQSLPSPSMVPRLSALRRDPTLMRQANSLVDGLDNTVSGMMLDKFSKQGWARSGGDLAPRVPTPWPHDHVMGQGRNSKLYYDDLNIYEWSQGILAIIEAEEDINVMRFMVPHYRAVYRDAQNHGFAAARWSNGVVLSMLEKGKLRWDETYKMAEERRSALVSVSSPHKEPDSTILPLKSQKVSRQFNEYQGNKSSNVNRNGGKKVTKICQFFNNGSCPHSSHHDNGLTRWRHVCRECWEPGHTIRECTTN
jgi:hypothetical protein